VGSASRASPRRLAHPRFRRTLSGASVHRFPKLTTADLEGTSLSLPGDFGADQVLLLIAYVREDQRAVDTWFPLGQRLEADLRRVLATTPC
jgi:hypothetical protein